MKKKILVVAAHPDDEVLGCGGTIMKHASRGDEVAVLFMTNGVGARGSDIEAIKQRKLSAEKVKKILKIKKLIFLDLPDNQLDTVPLLEIIKKIESVIKKFNPDTIYTHYINDLNIDHEITCRAVMTASRPQPKMRLKEIFSYEILSSTEWQIDRNSAFSPNFFNDISKEINSKIKALKSYSSEMRDYPHTRSIENQISQNKIRGASVGLKYAEAFSILRIIN